MDKICLFCGIKPQSKNKEHVMPKWLIEHTGPANRKVRFGFDKKTGKPREFSYNSFTFPACESCNTKFAELESLTKPALLKLLSSSPLSKYDFHILLDWFDKVRTGFWLGFYYLDKNIGKIKPKFQIASRIGLHDRMLHIIRVDGNKDELSFRGCDMPSFYYTPSCFSIIINNYCFINISSPFLFSRRLGFPYPINSFYRNDGLADYEIKDCRKRIMQPLMRKPFKFKGSGIYQPIFRMQKLVPAYSVYYDNDYIKENSMSFEHGIGDIFLENRNKTELFPSSESSAWVPLFSYDREKLNPGISTHTIELQLFIDTFTPSHEKLSQKDQDWWKEMLRTNKSYGDYMIRILNDNAKKMKSLTMVSS
jgi:hypothetical protein